MYASLDSVSVFFGAEEILENVSASIHEGDRIGLIGKNGAGKTTLLNTLIREIAPEQGSVFHQSGLRIGYLRQNGGLTSSRGIMEEMRSVFSDVLAAEARMREIEEALKRTPEDPALGAEYNRLLNLIEARDGYQVDIKIRRVLNGMGFAGRDLTTPVGVLSGGEKTRLAVAKLLLENPDLLILDEPTNHLDFTTLRWLEEYLSGYAGAVLTVSHDRYFLDKVANKIWEIEDGRLREYRGNYTAFKKTKAERIAFELKEYEKQQRQIQSMEEYVRKNIARASTSSSAKSRIAQLSHIERIEKPRTQEKTPSLRFETKRRSGNDVLFVRGLRLCVGEEKKQLIDEIDLEVKRGQKIAIIGENGSGKSTLLKSLLGILPQETGEILWGKNTDLGYYDQENKNMDEGKTVLNELWDRYPSWPEQQARGMLGRVLLTGEDVYKKVGSLSGGERAKLGFSLLMSGKYNVLLLDEPTNHLDLSTRESLEQALLEYDGTLLFVSHDRYFIRALGQEILELGDGRMALFHGNFEEMEAARAQQAAAPEETRGSAKKEGKTSAKQQRAENAKRKDAIARIERRIADLEAEEAELNEQIAAQASDFEALSALCSRLEEVKREHESAMEEWLELSQE